MESKSRADFESWAKSEGFSVARGIPKDCVSAIYTDGETYCLWQAWQASRSALVVEIASHTEFEIEHMASPDKEGYAIGWIDGRNYSVKQVRSAGITVKGEGDDTQP
jgi:hypothetical protein